MGEGDIGAPGIDNVEVTGDNASAITSPAARKSVRRSVTTEAPKTRYVSAPASAGSSLTDTLSTGYSPEAPGARMPSGLVLGPRL